jgi:hypothetical protein
MIDGLMALDSMMERNSRIVLLLLGSLISGEDNP